jgi:hypothetical protein
MKKHFVTLLILTLVALPGLLSAQTLVKAQVPFDFVAKGQSMPAGECTISAASQAQAVLLVNCGDKHVFLGASASESLNASARTSVLFHKYGNRYFLAGINREGENRGYEIPATKAEKELTARNATTSNVTLLASAK